MPTHHHSEGTSFPALTWPHLDDHRPVDQAPTNHSSTGQTRVEMTASRTPSSSQTCWIPEFPQPSQNPEG